MNEEEPELIFTYDVIELGKRVKNKRKKNGFTQEDVSRMTGVSESTISRIENGKLPNPERNTIERLSRWVGDDEPREGIVAVPYYECVIASTCRSPKLDPTSLFKSLTC